MTVGPLGVFRICRRRADASVFRCEPMTIKTANVGKENSCWVQSLAM
jgi:hypothetical protein